MEFSNPHIQDLIDFQGSGREKELFDIYWNRERLDPSEITPLWDSSYEAGRLNWELTKEDFKTMELLRIDLPSLIDCIYGSESYRFPKVYDEASEDQFLRIIDCWLRKVSLPPPVITQRKDEFLSKYDGFHRLAVCSLLGVKTIPCWIVPTQKNNLIQRIKK